MDNTEFKQIRGQLNLTQAELSQALDISLSSVRFYEQGRQKIPYKIEYLLSKLIHPNKKKERQESYKSEAAIINESAQGATMDVRDVDTINMTDIVGFIMKNMDEFKRSPEIQLLLEVERKKGKLEITEQFLLDRSKSR